MALDETIPLSSPTALRSLLARHGFRIKKRLGQNFLVDSSVLARIVDAAALDEDSDVLEIGPGPGVLTRELASRARRVTAIEYDRSLSPILAETVAPLGNVRILLADAVRLLEAAPVPTLFEDEIAAPAPRYIAVSNLPYGITSPAIAALLGQKHWLRSIVLMLQREVADRLTASAGSESYGALTVFVSYHARVERLFTVSQRSFFPAPDVDSAVVRLTPAPEGTVSVRDPERLIAVSRALFGQRRKTAQNALQALPDRPSRIQVVEAIARAGVDPGVRGEDLTLHQIAAIADALPSGAAEPAIL